jgi:hypothetical protein
MGSNTSKIVGAEDALGVCWPKQTISIVSPSCSCGADMIWVLYIGGGLLGLFAVIMVWGSLHYRQSKRKALGEIQGIELGDIETLATECVDVFDRKLGVRLNLDNCETAAQQLDEAFGDRYKLKEAFAREDFYWYFVKPVGACLGELLRRHAKHEWRKKAGEAPSMEVKLKDGHSEVFPFEKVIKHVQWGEPGDLMAYIVFAGVLEQSGELE